jgi:hypothetical protein
MALDPPLSTVDPGGGPATHTLRVRNNGDTVEEYGLSVVGPLSTWTQVAPDRLRIYPGDEATATITVAVPHPPSAAAGPTPFGVRVVPRMHPELSDVVEGTVTVAPVAQLHTSRVELTEFGDGQQVRAAHTSLLRETDGGFTIVNRATGACLTDAGNGRSTVGADCRPQRAQAQTWVLEQS